MSGVVSVTAPVGGLNARDSLAEMKPTDAVILDNWFCRPDNVISRKGYTSHVTGITGDVQTLMDYDSPTGTEALWAVADNGGACSIYDVTTAGSVGAAAVTGLTSAQYRYVNFSNSGGSYAYYVNGADDPLLYDGSTFTAINGASSPAITGVTTANLIDVAVHMRRLWFVEKDTMLGWYLAADAISGAATSFDFGPLFRLGGSIQAITSWTVDAGIGMDDHFVVMTTNGEVAIYKGTDVSSSTTWALVGVYHAGRPIGRNCFTEVGGDVAVVTEDGVIPLTKLLISGRVANAVALTDKIRDKITTDSASYFSNYGWSATLFPAQSMLIVNVPTSSTTSVQYAMNTISGAWSRFTGLNARSWHVVNGKIYFSVSGGTIYQFWNGTNDNGSEITCECLTAFNKFGRESQSKFIKMARIILGYDSAVALQATVNVDFDQSAPVGSPTFVTVTTALWDTAKWDTDVWAGNVTVNRDWRGLSGIGYWASIHFKAISDVSNIEFYAVDYLMDKGGVL